MQIASIPYKFTSIWASSAPSSILTNPIPVTSTGAAASQQQGFPVLTGTPTSAGGIPPAQDDFNGVLQYCTAWIQWHQAGAAIQYDANLQTNIGGYPIYSIIQSVAYPGNLWQSSVDNNTSDPDTGGANWNQFPSHLPRYVQDVGTVNAIAGSLAFPVTSYSQLLGTLINIKVAFSNTSTATINLNSLGPVGTINSDGTTSIQANCFSSGGIITVVYDGAHFQVISVANSNAHGYQVFEANGTFVAPSITNPINTNGVVYAYNVSQVFVECYGAGGGGSGGAGASGAGGGYAANWVTVMPGSSYPVVVGAGGAASALPCPPGQGGGPYQAANGGNSSALGLTADGGTGGGAGPGPGGTATGPANTIGLQGGGGTDLNTSTSYFEGAVGNAVGGNGAGPWGGQGGNSWPSTLGGGILPVGPGGGGGADADITTGNNAQAGAVGLVIISW